MKRLLVYAFLGFIFGIALINVIVPDQAISEVENRSLQQLPAFSWNRLVDGTFTEEFELYMTDQFVEKTRWVGLKSDIQRLGFRQHENNGIFFASDNYLLEVFQDEGQHFQRNLDLIKGFQDRYPQLPTTVALIPTAVAIHARRLPPFAPVLDQQELLVQAKATLGESLLDVSQTLKRHQEEDIYFRTDHHWTMLGAYYGYLEILENWQIAPNTDYDIKRVSDSFYGTYYARANNFHLPPDFIDVYLPTTDIQFTLQRSDDLEPRNSLYVDEFLDRRDQYAYFLGGVDGYMHITSTAGTHKKLLIFKDSYAHNLIPFLAQHFDDIYVIDLRYYNLALHPFIESLQPDQTLFLYNLSSFGGDSSMVRLR